MVLGLGTVWILDGLEVTIVGSMSDALRPHDTGLGMTGWLVWRNVRESPRWLGLFIHGDTLSTFFGVGQTGWYLAIFAVSNVAGALLLSPLFDRIGRVPMITATYVISGVLPCSPWPGSSSAISTGPR